MTGTRGDLTGVRKLESTAEVAFSRELIDSLIALRLTYKDWAVRRVDRITFLDTDTTRKESEFHFILPKGLPTIQMAGKEKVHLLPLVTFERNVPLRSLKVTDESGSLLSTLTKQEHRMVTEQVFESLQRGSSASLSPSDLEYIYMPRPDRGPSMSVPRVEEREGETDVTNWWSEELERFLETKVPAEDVALRTFVIDLWLGYLHIVVVPMTDHGDEGNRRRVITMSHEERVAVHSEPKERVSSPAISELSPLEGEFGGGLRQLRRLLGLSESDQRPGKLRRFFLEPQWVRILWAKWYDDEYGSCHTEITVPPELEVRQSFLYQREHRSDEVSKPQHGRDLHYGGEWSLYTSAYTGSSAHLLKMGALNGWRLVAPGQAGKDPEEVDAPEEENEPEEVSAFEDENATGEGDRKGDEALSGKRPYEFSLKTKNIPVSKKGLMSGPEPSERGLVAIVSIVLSARSEGLRRSVGLVGLFSLAMLVWALVLVRLAPWTGAGNGPVIPNLEVLATVLVFAPTIAAALVSQRASHPMTQELTAGLRFIVVAFGVLPVVAVVVLAMSKGLGPYPEFGELASTLLISFLILVALALLGILWYQKRVEAKIDPEPLPRSRYWDPGADPRGDPHKGLISDPKAKALVEASLRAQPPTTKVIESVEGLRLPCASFFSVINVAGPPGTQGTQIDPRHSWLTDAALRRSARKYAESAGIDLS